MFLPYSYILCAVLESLGDMMTFYGITWLKIGDSLGNFNGFEIILTTENGVEVTNRIILDFNIYKELLNYVIRLKLAYKDKVNDWTR